jgi:hypothetical protein
MKEVFDATLGRHGRTRYRSDDGRFAPNPNKGKQWYCQKSPTSAHHWIIIGYGGRCKYCRELRELLLSAPTSALKRGRES